MNVLNYINGEFKAAKSGQVLDLYNPANGEVYGHAPDSDINDVNEAVAAAKAAFPAWSKTPVEKRYQLMERIASLIEEDLDALAAAESKDNGKPLWLAKKVDIPRATSNFRFFATAIMQFHTEAHEMVGSAINYTLRQPLGVVSCISPWNLPLYLFTWKIAPAIAAGNTVVAKPSEITPVTAYLLAKKCQEAGLPPGVLNILHGYGDRAGQPMTEHKDVKAISFTGSTKIGGQIASIAAPRFKKVSLEMGGKNPNLIFADCNYDLALKTTVSSSFANQGQICLCGSRIMVERSIYNAFRDDFVARVKKMKVGHPSAEDTKVGALVSEQHMNKVLSYIKLAQEEGGKVLCGGERVHPKGSENGYYVAPTVIEGLDQNCRTNQEEIFGPVVTLSPFDSEEEALEMANATPYGLSSTIWTENLSRAHRLAQEIHAGIVWINTWLLRDLRTPFGGVKQSGVGREGGFEALRFFTEPKNVCIQFDQK